MFLILIKSKLEELNIPFNVEDLITDVELSIHESVDEMLPKFKILGCLFHFTKAIKRKIDKKQMKNLYDNNAEFRKFIKKVVALSSLPLSDLEK